MKPTYRSLLFCLLLLLAAPARAQAPTQVGALGDLQSNGVNPTIDVEEARSSYFTFGTGTEGYALARSYLERGSLPDESSVRGEDFVNAFDYGDTPDTPRLFTFHVEGFPSPARKGYHVFRVTVRARGPSTPGVPPPLVAKDAKVQLEFNPGSVARYRLLGYETRPQEPPKDSVDDKPTIEGVDVHAGDTITALYEVKLIAPALYFAAVGVLYDEPEGGLAKAKVDKSLPSSQLRSSIAKAQPSTRLAYVASAFAEKLRGSYWVRTLSWSQLHALWEGLGSPLKEQKDVAELGALIKKAQSLDQREDRFEAVAPLRTMDFDSTPKPKK